MDVSLVSVLTSLKPAVHIAALVPFFIALMMWLVFYIRFDLNRLKKISVSFQKLADEGAKIKDCKKENISFMDEMLVRMAPQYFLEAWLRMQMQLDKSYKGDFIPEAQSFYDFDAMVTDPCCRGRLDSLWRSFWVLGMLTALLPVGITYFIHPGSAVKALVFGAFLFFLLCFLFLLFTLLDQKIYFTAKSQYDRFVGAFNRVLPVAKAEVALLLEATQRNQTVYQESTQKIVERFDRIADDTLLPALEDSIEVIMRSNLIPAIHNIERTLDSNLTRTLELQDNGMERMTAAFADRLGDTIEVKMNALADTIGHVQNSMELLDRDLQGHVHSVTKTMTDVLALQEGQMEKISTTFVDTLTNTFDVQMTSLVMTISEIRGQIEELGFGLSNHVAELMETTKTTLVLQQEQSMNSIALQDDRHKKMLEAQDERINQLIDQQTKQMTAITVSFTESLTATLSTSIAGLNREIGDLHLQMGELNDKLFHNIDALTEMLNGQGKVLEESAKMLIDSEALQQRAIEETRDLQVKAVENSELLNNRVQSMADIIDKLTEQTMTFSRDAFKFTKETNEAQIKMSEGVQISQVKLEAAVNETMSQYSKMNNMISDMMDNITDRMNEAMINAGKEIAYGIKEVTADNAEAISNLTEQAQHLRSDYEAYFSRMEDNGTRLIEEMDYQVKTIIARISEDIGAMMKENIQANADILERYKDNTTDLLQSFDEQARSIGLYAREINMDITDLSNNLQASVSEFSGKMLEGVRFTLGEFDNGLSELSQRIANTVERISDAVEALPEALDRK